MQSYQTTKPKPRGDRENSTYRWELFLENGYTFDGYSKFEGHAEKQDKEALLEDCIQRLGNNGYFSKCYQMVFYKREFMHKSQDTKILELFPGHYLAHGEVRLRLPTLEYLNRVYERINNGGELDFKKLLPERVPYRSNEKNDFEFTKDRFPTLDTVVTHCAEYLLREKNYPRARVEGWYHKVKHYYSNQSLPVASPTVRPASVDVAPAVPPHKAAAQAMATVNVLHTKFKAN
ncbi:hypothetical protein GCM10028818_00030 [Spirosoma horti]